MFVIFGSCLGFSHESSSLENTRMVSEFMDVFSIDLSGVPSVRDIDFSIGMEPGTKPITIAPIGWP